MEFLNRAAIQDVIAHKEPFLLIDRVVADYGKGAVGWFSCPWLNSTRVPIFLIIEALAEVGAVALLGLPENKGKNALLTGLRRWKFPPVESTGPIRLEASLSAARLGMVRGDCRAEASGQLLAQGEIVCVLVDREFKDLRVVN